MSAAARTRSPAARTRSPAPAPTPPPVAARTQPGRQAESDAAMAAAAVSLICERGAAATTLKDVGVRAGYSRGLAGYRFGTKAGLWGFLVHRIGEEWLAELGRAARGTTGLQTLHAALDAHCAILVESPDRFRAFYTLWFDSVGPDPGLRAQIAGIHERRRRDVERWIRAGIAGGTVRPQADVCGTAEQFVSQIVGIVYAWLVADPDTPDHGRVAEQHAHLKRQMTEALAPAARQE